MPNQYQHISAGARALVDLPFGCDDNDVARAVLRRMGLQVPVAVLGDTGIWFRQLMIELDLAPPRDAANEAMAVLPSRHREILRLLGASTVDELGKLLPMLLERVLRERSNRP